MTRNLRLQTTLAAALLFVFVTAASAQITSNAGDGVLNAPYRGTITSLREATMDVPFGEVKTHIVPDANLQISSNWVQIWIDEETPWDRSVLRLYQGVDASGAEIDLTGTSQNEYESVSPGPNNFARFSLKAIGTKTLVPQSFKVYFRYVDQLFVDRTKERTFTVAPMTGSFQTLPGLSEAFHFGTPLLDVAVGNAQLRIPVGRTAAMIGCAFIDKRRSAGGGSSIPTTDVIFPGAAESVFIQNHMQFALGGSASGPCKNAFGTPWPGYFVGYKATADILGPDGTVWEANPSDNADGAVRLEYQIPCGLVSFANATQKFLVENPTDQFDVFVDRIHDQNAPANTITLTRNAADVVTEIETSDGRGWTIDSDPADGWITGIVPDSGKGARYFKYNADGRVIQVRLGEDDGDAPGDPDLGDQIMFKFVYDAAGDLSEEWRFVDGQLRKVVEHVFEEAFVDEGHRQRKEYYGVGASDFRQYDFWYDVANGLNHRLASAASYPEPGGSGTPYTTTYTHDVENPRGNVALERVDLPDGTWITHEYDSHVHDTQTPTEFGFRTKTIHHGSTDGALTTLDVDYEFFYYGRVFHSPRIVKQRDGRHSPSALSTEVTFDYEDGWEDENTDGLYGEESNQLLSRSGPTILLGTSGTRQPETRYAYNRWFYTLSQTETDYASGLSRNVAFDCDTLCRPILKAVDPNGKNLVTQYLYCDASSTQDRIVIDPDGYWTVQQFDADGRVISDRVYLNPNAGDPSDPCLPATGPYYETSYLYNTAGRLSQTVVDNKDQAGNVLTPATITTEYTYDRLGRLLSRIVDPGGINQEVHYEYNWLNDITREYDTSERGVMLTYDGRGLVATEIPLAENQSLATSLATKHLYDALGRLQSTKTPTGRILETVYDDFGRVHHSKRHPGPVGGNTITTTFEYDKASNITRTTVQEESVILSDTTAKYDEAGFQYETRQRTVAGTNSEDDPLVQLGFDWMGNVVEQRAPGDTITDDRVITTLYDNTNRVEWITDSEGSKIQLVRDDRGNVTEQRVALSATATAITSTIFDALSRATRITQPEDADIGGVRHYQEHWHDSRGNLLCTTHVDASGTKQMTTVFGYDNAGRRERTAVLADASATTTAATASLTEDRVVVRTYDADGRLLASTRYNHNAATPHVTSTTYDAIGRVDTITDPAGCTSDNYYDPTNGRLLNRVINDGIAPRTFAFDYDGHDRVIQQTALGTPNLPTFFDYEGLNRRTRVTDARGIQTQTDYDLVGRTERVIEDEGGPLERHTEFAYNRHSDLVTRSTCNASSTGSQLLDQETSYRYDSLGRLLRTVYPDSTDDPDNSPWDDSVIMAYDNAGRLTTRIDQRGMQTEYTCDDRGLVLTRTTNGVIRDTFTYDALGRLEGTQRGTPADPDAVSASILAYTDLGNVDYEDQIISGGTPRRVNYAHDQAGNRTQATYPGGDTLVYSPTAINRVDAITLNGNPLADYAYQGHVLDKRQTTTTAAGGSTLYECDFGYDGHRRVNAVHNNLEIGATPPQTLAHYSFTRDNNGNPLTQTVEGLAPFSDDDRMFTVDELNRLTATEYTTTSDTESVVLDLAGNRETHTDADSTVRTYSLDNEANEYATIDGQTVNYDDAGNLITDEAGRTYGYDEQKRLVTVHAADLTLLANYTYDAFGRRIVFEDPVSGVTTRYYYDGQSVIEERDGTDARVRYHVHGPQFIDEHIATFNEAGTSNYYLLNDLYTVAGIGDADGNIVEDYEYSAFGLSEISHGPDCLRGDLDDDGVVDLADAVMFTWVLVNGDGTDQMLCAADLNEDGLQNGEDIQPFLNCLIDDDCPTQPSAPSPLNSPYTLHGRPVDVLSDGLMLQYNRARHYDVTNGRWLQRDPKGYVDGSNLYEAFRGNPSVNVDPKGKSTKLASGWNNGDEVFWQKIDLFGGVNREFSVGEYHLFNNQKIIVYRNDIEGRGYYYVLPFKVVETWAKQTSVSDLDYEDFVRLHGIAVERHTGKKVERTFGEELAAFFETELREDMRRADEMLNSVNINNILGNASSQVLLGEDITTEKTVPPRYRVVSLFQTVAELVPAAKSFSQLMPSQRFGSLKTAAGAGARKTTAKYLYDARVSRYRDVASGRFVAARDLPWPKNAGFVQSTRKTVCAGTILDRYGAPSGRFLGKPGASISARGMAAGTEGLPYTQYRVLRPFEARVGPAAAVPEFGATGGATQYLPGKTVQALLDNGYLEIVK